MKDLLNFDWGIVELTDNVLKCSKCGESMNSPKKAYSLRNHLTMIFGFIHYHNNFCDELSDKTPII